ncbi:type IV pilus modification PilV family protein [Fodinibius sp. AD559]|uniref:type IV pilus modification PilV family protein n=1 Tax=Fodinibius sp. AD559 TaxID=3424179 RepID=UPI004046982B
MVGFSELLQTMAAMVLFSLILMTSNKLIFLNSQVETESEAEKRALTIAQTYIDEARVLAFDANSTSGPPVNIPEGFSACGSGAGENSRSDFNDFDDYHNWTEIVDWEPGTGDGAFQVDIEVQYVNPPNYDMASGHTGAPYTEYKKMVVTVTSEYLKRSNGENIQIQLPYLRQYYKTQ